MSRATLLSAHLYDAVVFSRGVDHHPAFADADREWLLDVDILTGLACHHRRERVPMVGCADDDCIDVFLLQHLSKVAGDVGGLLAVLVAHGLEGLRGLLIVDVTQGDTFNILEAQHRS